MCTKCDLVSPVATRCVCW